MIEELFQVTFDVPDHIDMNSSEFEDKFIQAVKDSIDSSTQDHGWRYVRAVFTSYHEALECERKFKDMFLSSNGKALP